MATALDLAGVEKPPHVFFNSLRPLLEGRQKQTSYPSVYGAYLGLQRSVTRDGWKLIAYPKAGVLRLYHLAEDPEEMKDLAASPAHAAKRQELFHELVRLSSEMGDQLDLKAVFAN
jgi:choline-sulfatase